MFLQSIDLTTALRPSLLPDEILLFVQDAVGLYGGKFKIPEYQNGQAYLTSHRACYVDNEEPRKRSVAINLKDVDHHEVYAGFLKSSPKVTFYPKPHLRSTSVLSSSGIGGSSGYDALKGSQLGSPLRQSFSSPAPAIPSNATWICPICSFSNPVPLNFEPVSANANTPLAPCLACGIKPPLIHVVKAALASISNRNPGLPTSITSPAFNTDLPNFDTARPIPPDAFQCPRCTFQNHPSLVTCEICGASIVSGPDRRPPTVANEGRRSDSPGPFGIVQPYNLPANESVKFSFRDGGDKTFVERLKGALTQRKWLLQSAPSPPSRDAVVGEEAKSSQRVVGIAGLERRGIELRKNNEVVIGNAFEDLAALMASAKEIIALAETFASQTRSSTPNPDGTPNSPTSSVPDTSALLSQLNLTTTKDMLAGGNSNALYLTELSRSLAEFLTDDTKGILKSAHGILSLVDLWAIFNRARGGVELVSPTDFKAAADLFDKLKLPVRLRKFKSGLLVVQGRDRTDEKTTRELLTWLADIKAVPPEKEVSWEWTTFGKGVTALETAERFGWSVGVAGEELEMAEERGALCREIGLEGIKFWENWLVKFDNEDNRFT